MRNFVSTKVFAILLVGFSLACCPADTQATNSDANALRSAFLGPTVWNADLSSKEITLQLQEHFSYVVQRLEATNASNLLLALRRAEAAATHPWTRMQRRSALIFLATNRQQQISRLRQYMHRGVFPINEGQARTSVPIFVDRHQTHCAVGYLMHSDGQDEVVATIVDTNNLVRVNDVQQGSLLTWIRTSGLTQEEAAMIQPGYPIGHDATLDQLTSTTPQLVRNGTTMSEVSVRGAQFVSPLASPGPVDATNARANLEFGKNQLATLATAGSAGVLFGTAGPQNGFLATPSNLDNWIYFGPNDALLGGSIFPVPAVSGRLDLIEIEYLLQANEGRFSQFSMTSLTNGPNFLQGEQSAFLVLSEIYDGRTDALLGEAQLFRRLSVATTLLPAPLDFDLVDLNTDLIRVKSYGMAIHSANPGDMAQLNSFFNEFSIAAVPEPTSAAGIGILTFGAAMVRRRRQQRHQHKMA